MQANKVAAGVKKYDLSKWKYAELRDAINTSCGRSNQSPQSDLRTSCLLEAVHVKKHVILETNMYYFVRLRD